MAVKVIKKTIVLGKYKFSMKNFREVYGHDDSLPYNGDVYVNGTKFAKCFNDGWGGDTNYNYADGIDNDFVQDVLDEIAKYEFRYAEIKIAPGVILKFDLTLSHLADKLAYLHLGVDIDKDKLFLKEE